MVDMRVLEALTLAVCGSESRLAHHLICRIGVMVSITAFQAVGKDSSSLYDSNNWATAAYSCAARFRLIKPFLIWGRVVIGSQVGLKNQCVYSRVGSSPTAPTTGSRLSIQKESSKRSNTRVSLVNNIYFVS